MAFRRVFFSLVQLAVCFVDGSVESHETESTYNEFERMVKTPGFVDHTMFIKHFIKAPFHTVMNAPKGFGKTFNLDMLKTFFEIPMGCNGREDPAKIQRVTQVFTRNNLYIAEKIVFQTIQQHFMRYPIVHFDFKRINATSLDTFESTFFDMIEAEFKRHSYVTANATAAIMALYSKGTPPTKTKFDESVGYNLAMLLHQFHNKPCIVFIDNYDHPLVSALFSKHLSESETEQIVEFLCRFLRGLVKGNFHVTRSLLTGCSSVGTIYKTHANNLKYYHVLDNKIMLVHYYGFSEGDVASIACKFGKQWELGSLRYWYGGFRITRGGNLYRPTSVLSYFKNREFKSFLPEETFPFREAFDSVEFSRKIEETIDNETRIVTQEQMNLADLKRLQSLVRSSDGYSKVDDKLMAFIMQHMTESGVYTVKNSFLSPTEKNITVTNHEGRVMLQEMVYTNRFLKEYFHVSEENSMAYLKALRQIGENKTELFLNKAHAIISRSSITSEEEMFVVLYYPINNDKTEIVQKHKFGVIFDQIKQRKAENPKGMDMLLISHDGDAILIQVHYNRNSSIEALGQIFENELDGAIDGYPIKGKYEVKNRIYIGMHYSAKENVTTLSYLFNDNAINRAVNLTAQN